MDLRRDVPQVSVLIPLYRVERYVERCLRSVLDQDYPCLRVVIIDDASPDASLQVAKNVVSSYGETDKEVLFYSRPQNGGLAAVRRDMWKRLSGKYTLFLDSDDYWCGTNVVREWVKVAESSGSSVVVSSFYREGVGGRTLVSPCMDSDSGQQFAIDVLLGKQEGYLWNKLFLTSTLLKFEDLFVEGRNMWEDMCMVVPYFYLAAEKVSYMPMPTNCYVLYNENALTKQWGPVYIECAGSMLTTWEERLRAPLFEDFNLRSALQVCRDRLCERLFRQEPYSLYGAIRKIGNGYAVSSLRACGWPLHRRLFYKMAQRPVTSIVSYLFYRLSAWFRSRLRR